MIKAHSPGAPHSRVENRRREHLIDQCLATIGKTWASSWVEQMSLAGRSIAGGWPGRLAEARALVLRDLTRELATQGMTPPSATELAGAPGTVNEHARTEWLRVSKAKRLARQGASRSQE